MRSFNQFLTICEAIYDRDKKSDVDLEVGKIGKERKKTTPERRRTKAVGGGKTAPAKDYKARKDIGKQRQASTRVQQPEKARGSAALSPREAQRKAALERRKSKSGGSKKDLEKAASKMLSKKTTKTVDPKYKATGKAGHTGTSKRQYTTPERQKLQRTGDRLLKDIQKKKEKPASSYDPKLGK
tara:strand:- start:91 stop:642 length:552 start_codon:yes stop_codon:yes gene_type:complete